MTRPHWTGSATRSTAGRERRSDWATPAEKMADLFGAPPAGGGQADHRLYASRYALGFATTVALLF